MLPLSHCWRRAQKFITNVSVQMSFHFIKIMEGVFEEAVAGAFFTKSNAIHRRDELLNVIAEQPDEPAETAEQPDTAERAIPAAAAVPEEGC